MKQVLIIALALTAAKAFGAGWQADAYPPWQYTRQAAAWQSCTYTAALERYYAARASHTLSAGDEPAAPAWWRSKRSTLINYKTLFRTACSAFMDVSTTGRDSAVTNYLQGLVSGRSAGLWDMPTFKPHTLCQAAGLPTNYLDYTPWRPLSGLGPPGFTNGPDYVVLGHAYGWTNEHTANGGTVPTNREAWRTSDYGWEGMTNLAALLTHSVGHFVQQAYPAGVHTSVKGGFWSLSDADSNAWSESSWNDIGYTSTWSGAKTYVETHYPTNNQRETSYIGPRHGSDGVWRDHDPDFFAASMNGAFQRWMSQGYYFTNTPTHHLDLYLFCDAAQWFVTVDTPPDPLVSFNDNGFNVKSNGWTLFTDDSGWNRASGINVGTDYFKQLSTEFGPTNGTLAAWCQEPNATNNDIYLGWDLTGADMDKDNFYRSTISNLALVVFDWIASTNGFQYY